MGAGRASRLRRLSLALLAVSIAGCGGITDPNGQDKSAALDRVKPDVSLPEPALRRLTRAQYNNAMRDLLGDGLILPTNLEPDKSTDGLRAIGASLTTISPRGVEQFEDAAFELVSQALDADSSTLIGCEPTDVVDDDCAGQVISLKRTNQMSL